MGREVALKVAVHRVEGAHPVIFNNVVRVFIDAGRADLLTLDMLDGDPVEFTDEEYGSLSVTVAELTALKVALPPPGSAPDAWDTDVHSEVGGEQGESEVEPVGGVVERSDEGGGDEPDDAGGEGEH